MTGPDRRHLTQRRENYAAVGATHPGDDHWADRPAGYRRFEQTILLGQGPAFWEVASSALVAWGMKSRSGFRVHPEVPPGASVQVDDRYWVVAHLGPARVHEPVQVVAVVDRPDRRGFAYGTLEGHPVAGEEAFIVHRDPDERVWLTLRSLTRAPSGWWRLFFPAALVAQRCYRRRYLVALRAGPEHP